MIDPLSLKRAELLHPKVRAEVPGIVQEISNALSGRAMFRIVSTLRTFDEQQALYNQGRTKPGPRVTNAKPGFSFHNYGLALDFAHVIDGKTTSWDIDKDWDGDHKSDWMEVVEIFKRHGWEWGGNWRSIKDYPHFQKTFGRTELQLLSLHNSGKVDAQGYVLI